MAKRYGRYTGLSAGLVKLRDNCRDVDRDYEKVVDAAMTLTATEGKARMQERAPWQDTTGNRDDREPGRARAALTTVPELTGSRKSIYFMHGVDYGIWLEINNHGKWQIIMPTVAYMGRQLMKSLRGTLTTMRSQ